MKIAGEGNDALIAAVGKIPEDIRFIWLTNDQVESARFRVIPFEFDDAQHPKIVKCVHPDWFARFDSVFASRG